MSLTKRASHDTPEERELKQQRARLAELEELLASCELERATLETQLLGFRRVYLEAVGALIAELDDLEASIAEAKARKQPRDAAAADNAARARKRAADSAQSFHEESRASLPKSEKPPSEDLRNLFHAVAKKVHPDLAASEEDRSIRDELMKRANEAYHMGDADALRSILGEYEARAENTGKQSASAQLAVLKSKIDLVERRLSEIRHEIDRMMASELSILRQRTEAAKLDGRNFFAELAAYLRDKIARAEIELQQAELGRKR